MTNRECMQSLPDDEFEMAMHCLYFKPNLWLENSNGSTPNVFQVTNWLSEDYKPKSKLWRYISGEEV